MKAGKLLILATLAACQARTELVLGVATDMKAPSSLDGVRLEVTRAGSDVSLLNTSWELPGEPGAQYALPGSFGIVSNGDLPIHIKLVGLRGPNDVVSREANVTLLDGQTLFYRMGLTAGCDTMIGMCGAGQTCVEGRCEQVELPSEQLPEYDPDLVTTLTCQSLAEYINTGDGTPMPFSEDAIDCPYILCSEGTCLDVPPTAKLYRGVCNAVSSFALVIDGDKAGASIGFFRGMEGTATEHEFTVPIVINGVATTFQGTIINERAYAISLEDNGSVRCEAYTGDIKRYCGTFTRSDGAMPVPGAPTTARIAFARNGDVMFGQYAEDRTVGLDLIGSFDAWLTATGNSDSFNMFWRNEAKVGIAIESGTGEGLLRGETITGHMTGISTGGTEVTGAFQADRASCRLNTLPNCGGRCSSGQTCIQDTCVGKGALRFTMTWDTKTDVDLHVRTPSGAEISWMNANAGMGRLDVDDQGEGKLVENVFFEQPQAGMYQFWAHNYDGTDMANVTITVSNLTATLQTQMGMVSPQQLESMHFMHNQP